MAVAYPCYQDNTHVLVDNYGYGAEEEKKPTFSWAIHICSAFTMCCCCWCVCFSSIFGMIGLLFSQSSYTDYKAADYERYKYKKGCAIGWMVAGLILGVGTIGGVGYLIFNYYDVITGLYDTVLAQIASIQESIAAAQAAADQIAAAG